MSAHKKEENKSDEITIKFTVKEIAALLELINIATKSQGLSVAKASVYLSDKINAELDKIKTQLPPVSNKK